MEILLQDLKPGQDYVIQIRAKDSNGQVSNWSQAYELATDSYTIAPSQPSEPVIIGNTLSAQVSHDLTKEAGGLLEGHVKHLEVHASTTTGFTPDSTTLQGTIAVSDVNVDVSGVFYYPTSTSLATLYWKVVAVDSIGNRSTPSNQSTGLPGLIQNANIADATITSAKIQNLEADKIIAGDGVVNDLLIKSTLTVADGGILESENFTAGSTGWQIDWNGFAEFNEVTIRGDIILNNERKITVVGADNAITIDSRPTSDPDLAAISFHNNETGSFDPDNHFSRITSEYGLTGGTPNQLKLDVYAPSQQSHSARAEVAVEAFDGISTDTAEVRLGAYRGSSAANCLVSAKDNEFDVRLNTSSTLRTRLNATSASSTDHGFWNIHKYIRSMDASGNINVWNDLSSLVTFQNGWNTDGTTTSEAQYKINALGEIEFRGGLISGTTTNDTIMFTLPAGFRPTQIHRQVVVNTNNLIGIRVIRVLTTGEVRIWGINAANGTVAAVGLYGLRFSIID